jgi:hypothetical protein
MIQPIFKQEGLLIGKGRSAGAGQCILDASDVERSAGRK